MKTFIRTIIFLVSITSLRSQDLKKLEYLVIKSNLGNKQTANSKKPQYFRKNSRIIRSKGDAKYNIPQEVNFIIEAPDGNYAIGFFEGEGPSNSIYFLYPTGDTKEIDITAYPKLSFSQNGSYVVIFNGFGRQIWILDSYGNMLQQYDYIHDLTGNPNYPLNNVFISEDASKILLQSNQLYLMTLEGDLIWKKPSSRVMNALFFEQKQLVLTTAIDKDNHSRGKSRFNLSVLRMNDGLNVESIKNLPIIKFHQGGILIQNENDKYYELEVK